LQLRLLKIDNRQRQLRLRLLPITAGYNHLSTPKVKYEFFQKKKLIISVYAQFPIGDVARLLTFWVDYSESECLHKEEGDRVKERPGVSRRGHSDA
jgi:hypothetical protein